MDPKELERSKLLEEIKRRAEQEELRRIEEEESKVLPEPGPATETPEVVDAETEIPDSPPPETVPELDEHVLIDLRGKFAIAVDRREVGRASKILTELSDVIPDSVELSSYEDQLRTLKREIREEKEAAVDDTIDDEEVDAEEPERMPTRRKGSAKKVKNTLKEAGSLYEQEKYDKAEAALKKLFELDPENEDGKDLQDSIEKARELASELREEEERRKEEEAAGTTPEIEMSEEDVDLDGDFWGSEKVHHGDAEFGELNLDGEEVKAPPKVPLTRKVVKQVSRVRIPVKPVLVSLVVVTVVWLGYHLADRIVPSPNHLSSSLLILPGWHSPSDSMAEYLSYALSEQIAEEFSRYSGLRVIAPTSAASLRYIRGGPAAASRALGTQYYLHWNIKTTPAHVTFDLTLRDTSTAEPVWVERKRSSIRELRSSVFEISQEIAASLDLPADVMQGPLSEQNLTAGPDALLRYLKGRFMLANRSRYSLTEITEQFNQAAIADADFLEAKTSLALTLLLDYEESPKPSERVLGNAAGLLTGIPVTNESSVDRFLVGGMIEQFGSRYEKAIEFYEAAAVRWPANAEIRRRLAIAQVMTGEVEGGQSNAELARVLDPMNVESFVVLGFIYEFNLEHRAAYQVYLNGAEHARSREAFLVRYTPELLVPLQEHDGADAILSQEIARLREDYVLYYRLGRVYQAAGKPMERWEDVFGKAQRLIARRLQARPDDSIARSYLALVLTRLGRHEEAKNEIEEALRRDRDHPEVFYNVARSYAMQTETSLALEYLDKAIGRKVDMDLIVDLDFFNLRGDKDYLAAVIR